MFRYIRKSKVLKLIENGQEQLRDKKDQLLLVCSKPKTVDEKLEYLKALDRLEGGVYFLECLKKHFK